MRETLAIALGSIVAVGLAALRAQEGDPGAGQSPPPASSAPSEAEALEDLRQRFADPVSALRGATELQALALGKAWPDATAAPPSGRVRLTAAAILNAAGAGAAARAAWADIGRSAADAETKAEAYFELGAHSFFRERYAEAWRHWRLVPQLAAQGRFAEGVARWRPFLELVAKERESAVLPDLRGSFGDLGEISLVRFRGRWVLLDYWRSDAPRAKYHVRRLRYLIEKARDRRWTGLVLGVNLDTERAAYEQALRWTRSDPEAAEAGSAPRLPAEAAAQPAIDWPQHHDGLGFHSPFLVALPVPRVPMDLLFDPDGKLVFVTGFRPQRGKDGRSRTLYAGIEALEKLILEPPKEE